MHFFGGGFPGSRYVWFQGNHHLYYSFNPHSYSIKPYKTVIKPPYKPRVTSPWPNMAPRKSVRAPPAVTLAIEPAKFWTEKRTENCRTFLDTPKDRTLGHYCWTPKIVAQWHIPGFHKFVAGGCIWLYHVDYHVKYQPSGNLTFS